mmetsp:Transcript_22383/g.49984  ORF Transcript_22383/g.49984 Transcript_22383/m.49984 type:complete len:93 (+) Transcript_22383:187-465(+)
MSEQTLWFSTIHYDVFIRRSKPSRACFPHESFLNHGTRKTTTILQNQQLFDEKLSMVVTCSQEMKHPKRRNLGQARDKPTLIKHHSDNSKTN